MKDARRVLFAIVIMCLGLAAMAPDCLDDDDDDSGYETFCCYLECLNGDFYNAENPYSDDPKEVQYSCEVWAESICEKQSNSEATRIDGNQCACREFTCPPDWWPGDDDDDDTQPENVYDDQSSGLTWQTWTGRNDSAPEGNLAALESYCSGLTWAGVEGWRGPSISELRSLVRGCPATATGGVCEVTDSCASMEECWEYDCNGCANYGGPGGNGYYWPDEMSCGQPAGSVWSTTMISDQPKNNWVMFFSNADIEVRDRDKSPMPFICVQ